MKVNIHKKVMEDARSNGNPCIRCGSIGTTCARHYNGIRQHHYGKGRGIKGHPFMVADFCIDCDSDFQEGSVPKDDIVRRIEYSEDFQHWCILSLIRRQERGIIG